MLGPFAKLSKLVITAELLSGNSVFFKQKPYPSPNACIPDRVIRGRIEALGDDRQFCKWLPGMKIAVSF
jgi:hypothetical protein